MAELVKLETQADMLFTPRAGYITRTLALNENGDVVELVKKSDGSFATIGGGGSSDGYVVVEEDGVLKAQKLTFDGTVASPDGSAEAIESVGLFNTGMEEPAYKGSGGGSFYKCASVDGTTWSGYKAFQNEDGTWGFESTITGDLIYETGFMPVIGKVYNFDATIETKLYTGALNVGLVLHASLSSDVSSAETGQTITKRGNPTYQTIDGIPCVRVEGYDNSLDVTSTNVPSNTAPATWSVWVKEMNGRFISLKDTGAVDGVNYVEFMATLPEEGKYVGGVAGAGELSVYEELSSDWHNIVMTRDEDGLYKLYCDGVLKGEQTITQGRTNGGYLALGYLAYYPSWGADGYMANLRVYDRALTAEEVVLLASELTPTA